jgi:hypothetical protein
MAPEGCVGDVGREPRRRRSGPESAIRRRVRLLLTAGAVFWGISAPAFASSGAAQSVGVVASLTGGATVTRGGLPPATLKVGDLLFWRDVVETREDGVARLVIAGKTTVTLRELSRIELSEERTTGGVRYTVELLSGKLRASVARLLMRPREDVQVRTRNAVASVRGTEFLVETVRRLDRASPFGLLGSREVRASAHAVGPASADTVVVTLSGLVEVSSRSGALPGGMRVGPQQAVRVSGLGLPAACEASSAGSIRADLTQEK